MVLDPNDPVNLKDASAVGINETSPEGAARDDFFCQDLRVDRQKILSTLAGKSDVPRIVHLATVVGNKCTASLPALHDAFLDQSSQGFLNRPQAEGGRRGQYDFGRQFLPGLPIPI